MATVSITHRLDKKLKTALDAVCEKHGLKQQAVITDALAAWLEDAADLVLIEERRTGPWVAWADAKNDL